MNARTFVVAVSATLFAGLGWLLTSYPRFDASAWAQVDAAVSGAALGAAGSWALLVVVGVVRDKWDDANAEVDRDAADRELTKIADVVRVLRSPGVDR